MFHFSRDWFKKNAGSPSVAAESSPVDTSNGGQKALGTSEDAIEEWRRGKFRDPDYVGSFGDVPKGSRAPGKRKKPQKPVEESTVLIAIHFPVNLWVLWHYLAQFDSFQMFLARSTHVEVAGMSALLVTAIWSARYLIHTARNQ